MVADLDTERAQPLVGDAARRSSATRFAVVARPRHRHRRRADRRLRRRARNWCCEAIANGKHVVTANKALLAMHGNEIFAAAQEKGVMVAFEAAVAGGIPIIKALREGLTANRIEWIAGIINGTTNFILSEMRDKGLDFDDRARARRRRWAMPRPIRPSTSKASTPRTSSPSCARSPSASRCSSSKAYVEGIAQAAGGRHPLRRAARLPHQAARHHAAHATKAASSCACIRR